MNPQQSAEWRALARDLWLVPVGSEQHKAHLAALRNSHYSRLWFCERWRAAMAERREKQKKFTRELYLRNRSRSRYKYDELFKQFDIPL